MESSRRTQAEEIDLSGLTLDFSPEEREKEFQLSLEKSRKVFSLTPAELARLRQPRDRISGRYR